MMWRILASLLLLIAVVLWRGDSVAAQDTGWSAPFELSDQARTKSKVSW